MHDVRDLENLTREELDALCTQLSDKLQAGFEAHEEQLAIASAHIDRSEAATTERAIAALQREERFNGEHDVCRAWLRSVGANGSSFSRILK